MGVGMPVVDARDAAVVVVLDPVHLIAGEPKAGNQRPVSAAQVVRARRGIQPQGPWTSPMPSSAVQTSGNSRSDKTRSRD
jgi:hypothetical protein